MSNFDDRVNQVVAPTIREIEAEIRDVRQLFLTSDDKQDLTPILQSLTQIHQELAKLGPIKSEIRQIQATINARQEEKRSDEPDSDSLWKRFSELADDSMYQILRKFWKDGDDVLLYIIGLELAKRLKGIERYLLALDLVTGQILKDTKLIPQILKKLEDCCSTMQRMMSEFISSVMENFMDLSNKIRDLNQSLIEYSQATDEWFEDFDEKIGGIGSELHQLAVLSQSTLPGIKTNSDNYDSDSNTRIRNVQSLVRQLNPVNTGTQINSLRARVNAVYSQVATIRGLL
jgi:hypothetical protein